MGTAENKNSVLRFMEAMRMGQIETCRDILDDKIIARIPRSGEIMGNARVVEGVDEVLKTRASVRSSYYSADVDFKIKAIIGEGDFVASFFELSSVLRNGKQYSNDYSFLFRFKNGKIAEWEACTDTAHVYREFGYLITKANL
jgi:ketosteroid isomerase-like protein